MLYVDIHVRPRQTDRQVYSDNVLCVYMTLCVYDRMVGMYCNATQDGCTSLMLAAESGHHDAVELLLQHHADTEERNLVQVQQLFTLSVCLSVCYNRQYNELH